MGFSSFSSLSSFSSDVFREEKGLGTMLWEGGFVSSREQVGFSGRRILACRFRGNPCQRWAIIIGFCVNEDSILKNRLTRG